MRTYAVTMCAVLGLFVSLSRAQWSVTNLHPPGASGSEASGIYGQSQVGAIEIDGFYHAALWSGSANSVVDLNPPGVLFSYATEVYENVQCGIRHYADKSGSSFHAGIWFSSPLTFVDLDPNYEGSTATAIHGNTICGTVILPGVFPAAWLWKGSYSSSLNVPWTTEAHGMDVCGNLVVGFLDGHAGYWTSSSPLSWVDLHPSGWSSSEGWGISETQQTGIVRSASKKDHASLWHGTPESWSLLHPNQAESSIAVRVHSGFQVGYVVIGGQKRASVWQGSASSWEDLGFSLPGTWNDSTASNVWCDGQTLSIVGTGFNTATNRFEALMWSRELPVSCKPDCDASGSLTIDDFICFQTNFVLGDPAADCDASGQLNIDDFICFQTAFSLGC